MTEKHLTLDDFSFEKTVIEPDEVRTFKSESRFMSLSVELLKEVGKISAILSCTYRLDEKKKPRKWTRNEAILGGLFVRLTKLQMGLLDQTCQKRMEIANILFRCLSETVINLAFLIKRSREALYDEYVEYSLKEEKRLLNLIEENMADRGYELPIEHRMRTSITRAFRASGLIPNQVDERKRRPWGGNIFNRARVADIEHMYFALMGLPSHAIHGNWQDLLMYHLEEKADGFVPSTAWATPRPQMVLAAAALSCRACKLYLCETLPECQEQRAMSSLIDDCAARVQRLGELHEDYLQPKPRGPSGFDGQPGDSLEISTPGQ